MAGKALPGCEATPHRVERDFTICAIARDHVLVLEGLILLDNFDYERRDPDRWWQANIYK